MAQKEPTSDSNQVVIALTMTVEQARLVKWVGRGPNEPIGNLMQSGQLTMRDLAWGVEGSYNPKCREASRILLANWLGQSATLEATRKFGPRVITGTNYLKEQALDRIMEFSTGIGVVLGVALMYLVLGLPQDIFQLIALSNRGNPNLVTWRIIISMAAIAFAVWYFYKQIRPKLDDYRTFSQGTEGEDRVVEQLRASLDNRWTIFRNFVIPNRKDDVDLVLVGPDGVWAVQVKSSKSTLRAQGTNWQVNTKKGWVAAAQNPASEVTSHARHLNILLQQNGIKRYVERAIALATEQPISYFETSEIPVWLPPTLEDRVKNLTTKYPPDVPEIQKIVGVLERLNELQTASSKK